MKRRRAPRLLVGAVLCAAGTLTTLGTASAGPAAKAKPFINGNVTAVSQAMQVAPKTGGFAYTITIGTSIADYRDTLAQASSQSLNLGLIGTALTTQQCDGSAPPLKNSQLPQPLVAESDTGNQSKTSTAAPVSKSGVLASGGQESVTATKAPSAAASFVGDTLGIPGVLTIQGFSSHDSARLVGHAREALSTSEIQQLAVAGGKVVLDHLLWTATQLSGQRTGATGNFRVGAVTVAGKKEAPTSSNLKTAIDAANKLLAPTGLHLTLPKVTQHGRQVTVTPLSVGMADSQVGAKLVSPVLQGAQPVIDAVTNALLGISCKTGSALTVADMWQGTLDGTGSTDLLFGGASVGTQLIASTNPFGTPTLGSSHPTVRGPTATVRTGSLGGAATAGSAGGVTPPSGGGQTATTGGASGQQPQVASATNAAATTSCSTTSNAGWPSCSSGNALGVGLIALGVLSAAGAADFATLRRRRLPDVSL